MRSCSCWSDARASLHLPSSTRATACSECCYRCSRSSLSALCRYHPITADRDTDLEYKLAFVFEGIPAERLLDSSFWFLVYRLLVVALSLPRRGART